jgi:acetylornithine/succinyldiaminopimelate/putrescine aminotransferase
MSRADATLARGDVSALLAHLESAHQDLAGRSIDARVAALERVSDLWLADGGRMRAAAASIADATGYAPAMIELCLERTFRAWRGDGLRRAFAHARAALAADGTPDRVARAPALVVALLAQNTPGLAVAPVYTALGLGAAVVVKSARGEPTFAPLLAASLGEVDADLGRACATHTWAGGNDSVERSLFAAADRIVAYGGTEAISAVREHGGERVIAHGPRVSVAVVAARAADLARRLAREIAFLDQRGCLSPQAVLVDARIEPRAFARELADELAACERDWPRRALAPAEAAAFRHAVDRAEARTLSGRAEALHGGGGLPWAVVVESSAELAPTPLDRFIRLHPFEGTAALGAALSPLRGLLECAGIAARADEHAALAEACRRAGASRICTIGSMQDPPADWHAGGRPPIVDLLSWSTGERSAEPAPGLHARFLAHVAQTSDAPRAIEVASARGSWVYDRGGRAWLDLLAGIGVASIGHAHPAVARAVAEQAARYTHVMVYGEDVLEPQVELATRLAALLPPSLSMVYLTNSGAEAIEGALKLARKATGRARALSFTGAFHGDTTGALALGGNPVYRAPFGPLLADVEQIEWDSVAALERIDRTVAVVFAEPVQAEAGVRVPARDFLPRLAARCREVGALLALDEVVTGLGRTGRWFAFEHWPGAEPDVLVLAKALGGGLPLGAFVARPELHRVLAHDPPLGHVTTFGGNPVSCAAALASLDVLARERLPERAALVGDHLRRELARHVGRGSLVAVRGLGLLIGIELASAAACARFVEACRDRRVLVGWTLHHDRVVRLAPPLNLTDLEAAHALDVLSSALDQIAGD